MPTSPGSDVPIMHSNYLIPESNKTHGIVEYPIRGTYTSSCSWCIHHMLSRIPWALFRLFWHNIADPKEWSASCRVLSMHGRREGDERGGRGEEEMLEKRELSPLFQTGVNIEWITYL